MTRMQNAIARLSNRLQQSDGRAVVYQQGASLTIENITAVPTDEVYKVFDGNGVMTQVQSVDWIFKASSLSSITPKPGDRIAETINGTEYLYDVFPIGDLPCYEWHDNSREMLVLHTKRIQ